jgi:hypothetical protein
LNTHTPNTQNLSAENLTVEDKMLLAENSTVIKVTRKPVAKLEKPEIANGATTITDLTGATIANSQSGATTQKSAQSVAPRSKRYISRTEYIWEESTAPNARIILFSLLALLLVALLLWLNNFLR